MRRAVGEAFINSCRVFLPALGLVPFVGHAQTTAPPAEDTIEEIVVTGSRLVRRNLTAPSPITTVDRATIDSAGQPTIEETLNQMPQILPDYGRTSNNYGDSTARINLRGLGSNRTLVLLNGRRLAPSGISSSVDVNNLPQVLIDRVDIITGGATTVYGSDAVAGVVNFILREDFDGVAVDASAYATEQGDSEAYDLNVAWGTGFADDRGHATLYGGWLERDATFAGERAFSETPYIEDGAGNLVAGGSLVIPGGVVHEPEVDLGNGVAPVRFTPEGIPVSFVFPDDLYNYAPINYLQIPLARLGGGIFADYELGSHAEIYTEITHTRNEIQRNLAPSPADMIAETTIGNPVMTPEAQAVFAQFPLKGPDTVEFTFSRRMEELGPRIFDATSDYSRILAGLRGELGVGWDFDAWVSYTRGEEEERLRNDASRSRMLQGLLVDPVTGNCRDLLNGCVPLNLFGAGLLSDDGVAFVRAPTFTNTTSRTQALASGFVRGPLLEAWAGPVNAAFGLEWRSDDGDFHADEALFEGDATGYDADSSVVGEESVIEVYAEAQVPLAENARFARRLSLELGARYSEYDKAGSTNAFKAGAEWEPFDGLRFRAMWQRSVRAPDLSEAFQEPYLTTSFNFFVWEPTDDLCSASADPVGQGNAAKCIEQGIPADQIGLWEATPLNYLQDRLGGNPALQPETAETVTVGAVYTGFDGWSLAVDYYRLEVADVIRQPDPYGTCFARENIDGTLCDRIGRDIANNDFNVSGIDYTLLNQGESVVEGVDAQVNFGFELPGRFALVADYADLSFDLIWTWQWKNSTQDLPILEPVDCAGFFGYPCMVLHDYSVSAFPENRVSAAAQYISGNFDARVAWRWIEGTENAAVLYNQSVGLPPPELAIDSVDAKSYVDLSAGWRFSEQLAVRLQVSNLLGTDAPMMADAATGINTDTGFYDVFGRSYRLSASLRY